MSYHVKFYDLSGKLLCWYATNNKSEAEKYLLHGSQWYTAKVERVSA